MLKSILRCGAAMIAAASFSGSAHAITINLIDQGGVTGSAAEQGFRIAADFWEDMLVNSNVTLNFGVGYSALGAGIIGSTGSSAQDFTIANWRAGVLATRSASTLDQTAVLPTLSTGNANRSGAIEMIVSGPKTGGVGVNTAANRRVFDTDKTGAVSTNNKVLYLNTSNVKAVGGTATYAADNTQQLDAEITFSSNFGFDFDPTDGTSPMTFDFIGTAIHEMGHALGFVSGVDDYSYISTYSALQFPYDMDTTSWFSALDMFRYSNDPTNLVAGNGAVLDLSVGSPAFFSIDGSTQLFGSSLFATGPYGGDGDQASHWKDNNGADGCFVQLGIMDPTECYAQEDYVTALDLAAFDAIGWNLKLDVLQAGAGYKITTADIYRQFAPAVGAVPEPATWAMMIGGMGLVGGTMRRRRVSVAFA